MWKKKNSEEVSFSTTKDTLTHHKVICEENNLQTKCYRITLPKAAIQNKNKKNKNVNSFTK